MERMIERKENKKKGERRKVKGENKREIKK